MGKKYIEYIEQEKGTHAEFIFRNLQVSGMQNPPLRS